MLPFYAMKETLHVSAIFDGENIVIDCDGLTYSDAVGTVLSVEANLNTTGPDDGYMLISRYLDCLDDIPRNLLKNVTIGYSMDSDYGDMELTADPPLPDITSEDIREFTAEIIGQLEKNYLGDPMEMQSEDHQELMELLYSAARSRREMFRGE